MLASASWTPCEVSEALLRISADVRDFGRCLKRAKAAAGEGELRALASELGRGRDKLQNHRSQVRAWTTQGGSLSKSTLSALAAARTSVESELQKFRALEKELVKRGTALEQSAGQEDETMTRSRSESDGSRSERPPSPVGPLPATPELCPRLAAAEEEVRVLADQICGTDDEQERAAEFVCKICLVHVVGCSPKLAKCSHLFCGDCISKWMSAHRGSRSWAGRMSDDGLVPCPCCKEPLRDDSDLHAVRPGGPGGSGLVWKMLSGIKITCGNHPRCSPGGQCDWVGDYGSYKDHLLVCTNGPTHSQLEAEVLPAAAESEGTEPIERGQPEVLPAAAESEGTEPVERGQPEAEVPPAAAEPEGTEPAEQGAEQELGQITVSECELPGAEAELGHITVSEREPARVAAAVLGREPPAAEELPRHRERRRGAEDEAGSPRPQEAAAGRDEAGSRSRGAAERPGAADMAELQRARVEHFRLAQWQQEQARAAYARQAYSQQVARWQMAQAYQMLQYQAASGHDPARAAWLAQAWANRTQQHQWPRSSPGGPAGGCYAA